MYLHNNSPLDNQAEGVSQIFILRYPLCFLVNNPIYLKKLYWCPTTAIFGRKAKIVKLLHCYLYSNGWRGSDSRPTAWI